MAKGPICRLGSVVGRKDLFIYCEVSFHSRGVDFDFSFVEVLDIWKAYLMFLMIPNRVVESPHSSMIDPEK
jgi:hypothetical protein